MKEILKRIDDCIDSAAEEDSAAVGAEYPALFLYVGDKAAESCAQIRRHLKQKLINGGSILHAVLGAKRGDADFAVSAEIPDERGRTLEHLTADGERLTAFNNEAKKTADKLMMTSGFPQTTKSFLFIVTTSDSAYNALLPEFVMLFSENAHIRVYSYLFVNFAGGSEGYVSSAAFFRELEDCQKEDFTYDRAVMMREDQRISVHWDGPVFGTVFFLEMYRSDMKYSPHNAENNMRIVAMTAVLMDKAEPEKLPASVFCTAGISSARKPMKAISHIMYKALIDILAGTSDDADPDIPAERLVGYEAIYGVCSRVMSALPPVDNILSVLPRALGKDPDSVRNTNIRNILEYYEGADEEFFTEAYENACARMIDLCESIDVSEKIGEYINKGTLRLNGALKILEHDGAITACLNDVTDRLNSEEQELKEKLESVLNEPCHGLSTGLFSKSTGCDILAKAVTAKYRRKLEILRVRMMKRLTANILGQVNSLYAEASAASAKIKSFSDSLTEDILSELYEDESTLTDAAPFIACYTGAVRRALAESERSGEFAAVLKGRELYSLLMECDSKGTDGLADIALDIYRRLIASPAVREVFAMTFDSELYERYRSYDGGKDRGWVDAQLNRRLTEESRANLRYSVFQPNNSLFCMGNAELGFVKKMLEFEDPGFNTVHVSDVTSAAYEQLAIYNVPSPDSAVYVNECRKVYDGYVSEHGDSVYIDRNAAEN